jgi:hypothetical protein
MYSIGRASQFSRYLPGAVGSLDGDKNARAGVIKFIKNNAFRAFLAPFKRRELQRPTQWVRIFYAL